MKSKTWVLSVVGVLLVVVLGFFYASSTAGWWYLGFQTKQGSPPSDIRIPVAGAKLDRLHDDVAAGKGAADLDYLPNPFPAFYDSGPAKVIYTPQDEILAAHFGSETSFEISTTQGVRVKVDEGTALWVLTGRASAGTSTGPLVQHIFTLTLDGNNESDTGWHITESVEQFISE